MCRLYNLFVKWQNISKNDVKENLTKFENCKKHLLNLTISGQKKASGNKVIREQVRRFFTTAKTTASTTSFDILIKYPLTKNVILAWDQLEKDVFSLRTQVFADLSLHSLLLCVEVHREKKVSKVSTMLAVAVPDKARVPNISKLDTLVLPAISKKGSTKENIFEENINWRLRGKPHIHLCVTFYKNVLVSCVDEEILKSLLEKNLSGEVTINLLDIDGDSEGCLNITNHFIKCTQDISDVKTQKFLQNYTTLRSSCTFFSGHPDSVLLCRDLVLQINQFKSKSQVLFKRLNTVKINEPSFIPLR